MGFPKVKASVVSRYFERSIPELDVKVQFPKVVAVDQRRSRN
jgi:hypothetical protein